MKIDMMEKSKKMDPVNFMIPGCMFLGIGIGFIFTAVPVGLMIGLGVGLLLTGFLKMVHSKERKNGKAI